LEKNGGKNENIIDGTGSDGGSADGDGLLQQLSLQALLGPGLHGMPLPLQPLSVRAE